MKTRHQTKSIRANFRPQCEVLEDRRVPAGINIHGGRGNDLFRVYLETNGTITVERTLDFDSPDRATDGASASRTDTIVIFADDGDDVIEIGGLPASTQVIVHGENGIDTLQNDDPFNSGRWNVSGPNEGTLNVGVSFYTVERLMGSGSPDGDQFVIQPGAFISDSIDGRDRPLALLDYSSWTTDVTVDLKDGNAPGILASGGVQNIRCVVGGDGNDLLIGKSGTNILRGGNGHDVLYGRGGEDVLLGGPGNDFLRGEGNRDILIGGDGKDSLDGGANDDILIGGMTAFDSFTTANDQTLLELSRSWGDPTNDPYEDRVLTLRARLDASTVFADYNQDLLVGGDGRDWFHVEPNGVYFPWDLVLDWDPSLELVDVL